MNGYYNNNPGSPIMTPNGVIPNQYTAPSIIPEQEEYMSNILKKTEKVSMRVHATFPGSNEWRDKIFEGILEASGPDFILLHDPRNGAWSLVPKIYIDYIVFNEEIAEYIRKS